MMHALGQNNAHMCTARARAARRGADAASLTRSLHARRAGAICVRYRPVCLQLHPFPEAAAGG